jgi:glycopeptide antibiotics resistance protein
LDFLKSYKKIPLKWLLALIGAILLGILFVGLNPKDIFLPNNASWFMDPPGIRFGDYSLAYTDSLSKLVENNISEQNGFSIEIALKANSFHQEGFQFILLLHDGQDREQLLVGQWRSSIILMNGDDYNHKRRIKRLSIKTSSTQPLEQFVTITTGNDGTRVYFNGGLVGQRKDLTLKIPQGENTRLLLANSVYGWHPWKGDIYGLAFYGHALSAKDAKSHFKEWSNNRRFSFARTYNPIVLYYFDEKEGERVVNHMSTAHHLNVPSQMQVLEPEFFFQRLNEPSLSESFLKDAFLNFFGFLPFGIVLAAFFIRLGDPFETQCVFFTLMAGFTISLFIEIIQAWMPTRSSDMLDLILNTLGAMVGATICRALVNVGSDRAQRE